MRIIRCEGGLGNRLFTFALYKKLSKIYNNVYMDESSFIPSFGHDDIRVSNIFPESKYKVIEHINGFKCETHNSFLHKIGRVLLEKYSNHYICDSGIYNDSIMKFLPDNCYLRGYWQNEKYFADIRDTLLQELVFPSFIDERNSKYSIQMKADNSVSIHFRKGKDYLKNKFATGTCPITYYEEAIRYIKVHVENPKFYVFTDNVDWVNKNLFSCDYQLVDWNPSKGKTTYMDMQLMTMCKHNIIANSSYSWWGAWLNKNPNKIVIAPKKWMNTEVHKVWDIIPQSWIAL